MARATARPADRRAARGARPAPTTDAGAGPAVPDRRGRRCCRPTSCRATSRSSWTATAAGRASATCPSSRATPPASRRSATLLRHAVRRGVPVLTLYAFSRENWARSDEEVTGLFGLLEAAIRSETAELRAQGVRIRLLGRLDELPDDDPRARSARRSTRPPAATGCSSTSPSTTPAGPSSSTPSGGSPPAGSPPDEIDEAAISARALHGRPARPGPGDPDRRRAAALELPDLAVGLRRVLHAATRCGRTSDPTPSTPPCSSSPAAIAASGADRPAARRTMRQRAISAAVLVPVLLLVLAIGGPVLGRGRRPGRRSSRRSRSSGCSRAPGYAPFAALGTRAGAGRSSSTRPSPRSLEGSGAAARGDRDRPRRRSPRSPGSTRATACRPGWRRSSGRSTSSLLAFVIRLGHAAPDVPAGAPLSALGAERGWILLLVLAVWSYDTGRLPRRPEHRPDAVPDPHLAVEDRRGPRRRGRRHDGRRRRSCSWGLGQNPLHALAPRAAGRAGGPGRRPRRVDHQAGRRRQGLRHAHPGPRRDPRPGRLVPVRGAGRDPVCRRRHPLTRAGQGSGRRAGSPCSARPARSAARRVDVLAAHPDAFRVVALAAGSNAALLAEQAARLRPAAVALADERGVAGLDLPPGTERVGGRGRRSSTLATRDDVDLVVVGTGGVVSLRPVLAALRAGKVVATANKETLVAGGHLVMPLARALARRRRGRRARAIRTPARWPGSARSTRSTRRSGSASSARRWPASPR